MSQHQFYSKSNKNVLKQEDDMFDDTLKQQRKDNLDKLERAFEMALNQDTDDEDENTQDPPKVVKKESFKLTDSKSKMTLNKIINEKKSSSSQLVKQKPEEIKIERVDETLYQNVTKKMGYLIKPSFDNNTAFKRYCIADKVPDKNQILFTIWKEEASLKNGEPIMRIYIDKPLLLEKKKFVMKNKTMDIEKGVEFDMALRVVPTAGNPFYIWAENEKDMQDWDGSIRAMLKMDIFLTSPKGKPLDSPKKDVEKVDKVQTSSPVSNASFSNGPSNTSGGGKVSKLKDFFSRFTNSFKK